jgi:outer membrane lipoprotein LolB
MKLQYFLMLLLGVNLLGACANFPAPAEQPYRLAERSLFDNLKHWSFEGRFVFTDGNQSASASIFWQHLDHQDEIKLSGPLGQGAVVIVMTDRVVTIERAGEQILQSTEIETFVQQQLGLAIPVRALSYWVLGLVAPQAEFIEMNDGFEQLGWNVHYSQMQPVGIEWLPRKIKIEHEHVIFKLIVDQWVIV